MQRIPVATCTASWLLCASGAWAQAHPTEPVKRVVPFVPGGTTDIVVRVVAEKINGPLGQTLIVENRAGGVPKGLPKDMVDKVSTTVKKTLEDPALKKRIEEAGSLIVATTPAEFTALIAAEYEVYKKVVKLQKIALE